MQKAIVNYILQSLIITFLLSIGYYLFYTYGAPQLYTGNVYLVIGILFFVNIIFHSFFIQTIIKKNEAFVRRFLASTMLKLMIYLISLLIMIFIGLALIKVILISFLICYFVYTAHEISSILNFLKKNSSQHVKSK